MVVYLGSTAAHSGYVPGVHSSTQWWCTWGSQEHTVVVYLGSTAAHSGGVPGVNKSSHSCCVPGVHSSTQWLCTWDPQHDAVVLYLGSITAHIVVVYVHRVHISTQWLCSVYLGSTTAHSGGVPGIHNSTQRLCNWGS